MGDIANDSEPTPQATKILLVEDSFENRDMLTRRLQRRGFTVCSATDGSTGVAMSVSEMPDVILMDVALGEMDGWQATQLIKADARTSDIPIIALTAHALASDREKSVEVGCADFDTKPAEESNRRLNEQLSQANETLELRVADRTKDLARAIERLQSEVEQRERTQATIAHLAHHDALTDLPNRKLLADRLQMAIAYSARNGLMATAVFAFIMAMNEFVFALVLTRSQIVTFPVQITHYLSEQATYWAKIAAMSVLGTLPVFIAVTILQRYLVRGLTMGGLKG